VNFLQKSPKRFTFLFLLFGTVFSFTVFLHGSDMRWLPLIQAEGLGYYSYLPAAWIYQDADYEFAKKLGHQYYGRDIRNDFLNQAGEDKVNKYFPGVSLLLLPFFLIAHFLALLSGAEADGYSLLYQYGVGFAAAFWLVFGFDRMLSLLKESGLNQAHSIWISLTMILGTNLLYNTCSVPSQSHVYSFAVLSAAALHFKRWCCGTHYRYRNGVYFFLFFSLAIAIRPLAVIAFPGFLFFVDRPSSFVKSALRQVQRRSSLALSALAFALPLLYVVFWWKWQCNSWMVYSYTGEHFYLHKPHVFEFLFSFRKGWFIYHPILLLAFSGILLMWKQSGKRAFAFFLFWIFLIYVHASWWIWTYSVPFGQRVMIDYLVFILPPCAGLFQFVSLYKIKKNILRILILILVMFNLWRTWQYHEGIIPWEYVDAKLYFETITQTHRRQRYLVNEPRIRKRAQIPLNGMVMRQKSSSVPNASGMLAASLSINGREEWKGSMVIQAPSKEYRNHWRISGTLNTFSMEKQPELWLQFFHLGKPVHEQIHYFESSARLNHKVPFSVGGEWPSSLHCDSLVLEWRSYHESCKADLSLASFEWLSEDAEPEFVP
jgi:hypothetical protein